MNIDPWILGFSALTVIVTIWMGFWAARRSRTASDFFVAGRGVSVGWNASAISGEYLSAASFMGIAGMVMSSGYDALWYPVCYACGYLFLLLFIAGPLRRFGAYTIPDFAEGRYDSPVFRRIAVIFVLFIGFFYTMPQMKGAGTTLAYVLQDVDLRGGWFQFLAPRDANGLAQQGFPYVVGVMVVGVVITLNVALGGMKGITLVQAFQYWLKMFAISVPVFILMSVHGHYGRQVGANLAPGSDADRASARGSSSILSLPGVASANDLDGLMLRSVGRRLGRSRAVDPEMQAATRLDGAITNVLAGVTGGRREVQARAAFNLAVLQGRNLYGFAASNVTVAVALVHFATQTGIPVWMDDGPDGSASTLSFDTSPARFPERRDAAEAVASALARAGFPILGLNRGEAACLSAEVLSRLSTISGSFRQPLPEKAPRDGDWLSPFGPLTSKAAKAANLSSAEARPYALLYTYSLIMALVCGTAGLPHILVRFYTNPDGAAAKRTTMWVMILIGVFYLFPPVFGVMGRNLMPDLYSASGAKGTDKVVLELPRVLNGDGIAPGGIPVPRRPDLPTSKPLAGSILSGITCAGAFAAFMSTFSGLLVSMTGALAHDVYGRILRPRSTAADRMRMFKVFAWLIGGVATFLGCFVEPLQINFMVGQAFAIAAASYFPLLFMSVWWRGMTVRGAASGMLAGGTAAVLAVSVTNFSDLGWLPLKAYWVAHPLLRILCEQPAIWAVPAAIVVMVVVSKVTRRQVPRDIRMKMLVLHAPEALGLKQEYIRDHEAAH